MKKSTKQLLFAIGATTAAIYAYNKFVETTATKKNLLSKTKGNIYNWKDETIFYTKTGTGSPILLIHDANSSASSEEWNKLISYLEKNHTIYTLDLLGCGRSSKPAIEYTNYLYVQLITSFIKDIIKEETFVVATHMSASFVIMANHIDSSLFKKLILINPISIDQLDTKPDFISKLKMHMIELPFIGTFIYNIMSNHSHIDNEFRTKYYSRPQFISTSEEEIYYEAAHTNGSNGRYLYSSILGNYLNNTITHALKLLNTPTLIIGNDDYCNVNPNLEIVENTDNNLYPHMERPEKIASIIEKYVL